MATRPGRETSTGARCFHGRGGIRTHGTLSRTHTFQACALNHSATRPETLHCINTKRAGGATAEPARFRHAAGLPADRVRFELTVPLPVRRFSRPVLSTTQPPVREQPLNLAGHRRCV